MLNGTIHVLLFILVSASIVAAGGGAHLPPPRLMFKAKAVPTFVMASAQPVMVPLEVQAPMLNKGIQNLGTIATVQQLPTIIQPKQHTYTQDADIAGVVKPIQRVQTHVNTQYQDIVQPRTDFHSQRINDLLAPQQTDIYQTNVVQRLLNPVTRVDSQTRTLGVLPTVYNQQQMNGLQTAAVSTVNTFNAIQNPTPDFDKRAADAVWQGSPQYRQTDAPSNIQQANMMAPQQWQQQWQPQPQQWSQQQWQPQMPNIEEL